MMYTVQWPRFLLTVSLVRSRRLSQVLEWVLLVKHGATAHLTSHFTLAVKKFNSQEREDTDDDDGDCYSNLNCLITS